MLMPTLALVRCHCCDNRASLSDCCRVARWSLCNERLAAGNPFERLGADLGPAWTTSVRALATGHQGNEVTGTRPIRSVFTKDSQSVSPSGSFFILVTEFAQRVVDGMRQAKVGLADPHPARRWLRHEAA